MFLRLSSVYKYLWEVYSYYWSIAHRLYQSWDKALPWRPPARYATPTRCGHGNEDPCDVTEERGQELEGVRVGKKPRALMVGILSGGVRIVSRNSFKYVRVWKLIMATVSIIIGVFVEVKTGECTHDLEIDFKFYKSKPRMVMI